MAKPVVLGYWDIRGLAAPIRLLLEYSGTPWVDKLYVTGPGPDYDKSTWLNEKQNLGLDFPNNPYLIDEGNGVKLTQSHAILHYLARKHDLLGTTEEELIRMDQAEFEEMDLRSGFVGLCYNPEFEKLKPTYLSNLPQKLQQWSGFLGTRTWIAGEKLTFVDFSLFDILDQLLVLDSTALGSFQNLRDYHGRFGKLEKIEAYLGSERYVKCRLNNRMAKFGA